MPLSGQDNTKLEALVHDIYSELVEDACLGLCFEVHRAVKQGYFFLDETDQESMKEFGWYHDIQIVPKLWISQEWTYLAKCIINGKTKSASAQTAKD